MRKDKIVAGLDIGSSKISAVAALLNSGPTLDIAGQVTQASRGVSRGVKIVVNSRLLSLFRGYSPI